MNSHTHNLQQNNEHEADWWSKKGQSVYWFSVYTPGSASLSTEVTALATVMAQADRDRHTQPGRGWGSKVIYTSPPSPSVTWRKVVVDVLGKQWMMPVRRTAGTDSHWFNFSTKNNGWTRCITTLKTLPLAEPFISTVTTVKKNELRKSRFTQTQLIQGKLCICRQYGQFKRNNMNRKGTFSSMASSSFVITKNYLKWGAPQIRFFSHSSQKRWWWGHYVSSDWPRNPRNDLTETTKWKCFCYFDHRLYRKDNNKKRKSCKLRLRRGKPHKKRSTWSVFVLRGKTDKPKLIQINLPRCLPKMCGWV